MGYLKVLTAANDAAQKMTTHTEADAEVAALLARYDKVKVTSDEWVKKVDVLLKEWTLLDNTVTELKLGRQGQVLRGREPVLSGKDGVYPGRAEEHLQGEGGGRSVRVIIVNQTNSLNVVEDRPNIEHRTVNNATT